jgi:hypothetical protein
VKILIELNPTQEIRTLTHKNDFKAIGITIPEQLEDLPNGWISDIKDLKHPRELLPEVKSVIILVLQA